MRTAAAAPELWAPDVDARVASARATVTDAQERYQPAVTFALLSGGDDSTAMTHAVRDLVDAAVHVNTGIGLAATSQFVRDTCAAWGLPLIEAKTPRDVYRALVLAPDSLPRLPSEDGPRAPGFPGANAHGVTYFWLKQKRIAEVTRPYRLERQRVLLVTGIRLAESKRRLRALMSVPVRRKGRTVWASPILDWRSSDLAAYRREHPDCPRNEVSAHLHRSGECMCGAFADAAELDEAAYWYPNDPVVAEIREMEALLEEQGARNCRWGGGRLGSDGRFATRRSPGPLCVGCDRQLSLPT